MDKTISKSAMALATAIVSHTRGSVTISRSTLRQLISQSFICSEQHKKQVQGTIQCRAFLSQTTPWVKNSEPP